MRNNFNTTYHPKKLASLCTQLHILECKGTILFPYREVVLQVIAHACRNSDKA